MTKTNENQLQDKPLNTVFYEHASHQSTLMEGLNSLREEGHLLDISLVIEGRCFRAHKSVLASCSDYFRAMFTDNMLESRQNEICLNGISAKGFQLILDYAYTSHLALNLSNVQDALEAASHVQILAVIQTCSNYLESQIDTDNCVDIATIAETYSLGKLKMKVYRYMSGHLLEFSNSAEFYRLGPSQLETLLDLDYPVDCSEGDVLKIVLMWLLRLDALDLDVRLQLGQRLLHYIHFREISQRKLTQILTSTLPHLDSNKYEWQLYKTVLQCVQSNTSTATKNKSSLLNSRGMDVALLKIGGFGLSGITNEITYCFSGDNIWRHLTSIPHVEQCNFGTCVLDNELYIVGGCFNQSLQEIIHPFGFKFSPRYHKWTTMAPMKIERCRFTLNVVGDKIVAVGGASEVEEYETRTCELYNPTLDQWYMIKQLPAYLTQHAGASYDFRNNCSTNSVLYISGGLDRDNIQSNMYRYELDKDTWTQCSPMLKSRADHVMLTIGQHLYVCGGWTEDDQQRSRVLVDTIDMYSIENNCWTVVTKVPTPRYHAGIVALGSKIYFIGGFHSDAMFDKDTAAVEMYDLDSNVWTTEEKYPQDIWEHTCVSLFIPKCREDMRVMANLQIGD